MLGAGDVPAAVDGLPDMRRAADSRRTFPAGRILHLVGAPRVQAACCSAGPRSAEARPV